MRVSVPPRSSRCTGSESAVFDRIASLEEIGVTDFAAVEFGATPDEAAATRAVMKRLIAR
jgi:hypothetical protein